MKLLIRGMLVFLGMLWWLFFSCNAFADNSLPPLAREAAGQYCDICHAIDHRVVGPAWRDVAARYRDSTTYNYYGKIYPLEEGLIAKVTGGGSGNWGTIPMPANDPKLQKQDVIKQLVDYILKLH